ncbi:MAG: hypothetical protein PHU85_07755 [Phycisphaerae bacterium]|nr:hypothetical protein [Phycisphaerae bacterium]
MRVLVDQKSVEVTIPPGSLLSHLVEQVRAHVAGQRRVLENMIVDGQAAPADKLEQWLARPCDLIELVEFRTACPRAMALDTVAAVAALLEDSTQLYQGAAEKLTAGQTGKAMELLLGCLNFYKAAQEAVSQVVLLHKLDLERMTLGDQTVGQATRSLVGQLAEVKVALEARDFVLLADLLNYEFPKITSQWQAILSELGRVLKN